MSSKLYPAEKSAQSSFLNRLCVTSGERRVQLLVDDPLLPVLLLLSDIALSWLNLAQRGAESALLYSADDDSNNVSLTCPMHTLYIQNMIHVIV